MSFVNKLLASVGIGSAKVDTYLHQDQVSVGDTLSGTVKIIGGQTTQNIDRIYLHLMSRYIRKYDDRESLHNVELSKIQLVEPFVINPEETREFPFDLEIPLDTPMTFGKTRVWLLTGLDIDMALDPQDEDDVIVRPNHSIMAFINALELLGFQLREVECEYAPRLGRNFPFAQEFEFRPGGEFRNRLDELEVIFYPEPNGLHVLMEVDRKARNPIGLLLESLDLDEHYVRGFFSHEDLAADSGAIAASIRAAIMKHA